MSCRYLPAPGRRGQSVFKREEPGLGAIRFANRSAFSGDANLRDVGVAGSNPVTPTIDFNVKIFRTHCWGPGNFMPLGSIWGPVPWPRGTHRHLALFDQSKRK